MAYGFAIDFFLGLVQPLFPYTFDPVFGLLLGVGSPLTGARLTIVLVSIALSALISVLYYLLMDVEEYQRIKEKRETLNRKMKEAREDEDMDEANKYMKEMAGMQKEFFTVMLKPMFASMFIFFLLLPWMFVTFNPVVPLQGNGTMSGELVFNGHALPVTVEEAANRTVVVDGQNATIGEVITMDDMRWKLQAVDAEAGEAKFAAEIVPLPFSLPFLGDELGWLGAYILISIPFTFGFRKMLGIQ